MTKILEYKAIAHETFRQEELVLDLEGLQNEMLYLSINNQLVVNVPPGSTLCIENDPVSGRVEVIVVEGLSLSSVASQAYNRPVTTDPTSL